MKTYNPFVAAFLAGVVLSGSIGNGVLGAWVLFTLVALTILVALVGYCLEAQNDSDDPLVTETESSADFNPLWDLTAMWKRE